MVPRRTFVKRFKQIARRRWGRKSYNRGKFKRTVLIEQNRISNINVLLNTTCMVKFGLLTHSCCSITILHGYSDDTSYLLQYIKRLFISEYLRHTACHASFKLNFVRLRFSSNNFIVRPETS